MGEIERTDVKVSNHDYDVLADEDILVRKIMAGSGAALGFHSTCPPLSFGWNCNRGRQNVINLKDSIEINATPERVFEWLVQRFKDKESYQAWHPDHVDIRWIKGEPLQEGSIIYAEEYLHGDLHKLKFRITKIVPNRVIEYRSLFPLSILAPGNTFLIEPKGENSCIFTAMGSLRLPVWLFKKLHKKHKNKIEATEQHMKEEGENLKRALENKDK